MASFVEALPYTQWRDTARTLHAHTQVLGKLAARLAPPEPQLQHAALRLTARGWETLPLPAPNGSGALVVALDLRAGEAVVEHSDGRIRRIQLGDRAVGVVTREVLGAARDFAGEVSIDPTPQEVDWTVPLDMDTEHATYDAEHVRAYFRSATAAALALAAVRAPYRGRSTPVNAWWGSFDLAISLFSGAPAEPPSRDFVYRNAMTAQEIAIGWWPGSDAHPTAAFYAYAYPSADGFADVDLDVPGSRWDPELGEYLLEWSDVCARDDGSATVVRFARAVLAHGSDVCGWDPDLASSAVSEQSPVT